jgi:hypothetical protein
MPAYASANARRKRIRLAPNITLNYVLGDFLMKRILSAAAVAAVLAIGSSAVFAQTVPAQPVSGPIPTPGEGNGGLIFWAYDATRNVSIVDYLGLSFNDVVPTGTDMNTPGKVLDFGNIGSFASTFAASQNSNIFWGVAATDFLGGVTSTRIVSTGPVGGTVDAGAMNSAGLTAAAGKINDFILSVNAACTTNPCTANDPNQGQYAGTSLWADNFGGGLGWQATANPGEALGFYLVNAAAGPRPTGAVTTAFQAANGSYGEWLLDVTGNLTYSVANDTAPVPLPAGVWLLLSGLSGLVTIARRRNAAAA